MIKAENVTFEYDRLDEEGNIESKLTAVERFWKIHVCKAYQRTSDTYRWNSMGEWYGYQG